jgi:hypothetical protein
MIITVIIVNNDDDNHTQHTSHEPELNNLFLRLSASAEVTAERASQILTGTMKILIKS